MPYKNDAQRKAFHAMADRGEISESTVEEWDEATRGKKLPPGPKKKPPLQKWAESKK